MGRGQGEGALFKDARGFWTATVELPPKNGKRRRKVIRSKDKKVARDKLVKMQKDLSENGDMPTSSMRLEVWLRHWFRDIQAPRIAPKTIAVYRTMLEQYIIPSIGKYRLDKLSAEHVRQMHRYVTDQGLSPTTASQAHRVLSIALRDAVREGHATRNIATMVDAPKRARTELVTLNADHGIQIMQTVSQDRLGSRIAAALLTGARQGELIGLEIDRVSDVLDLSWQLQRFSWSHGCEKLESGKPACEYSQGARCPQRHLEAPIDREYRHLEGGLWLSRPKSSAGWRIVPLVDPLKSILERRIEASLSEPNPHGLVWTADPQLNRKTGQLELDGGPLDPSRDNKAWHAALKRAGVPDARLHDARHATVDLLYEAEVREELIMEIVGHSTVAMSRKYRSRGNKDQLRAAMVKMSQQFLTSNPTADSPHLGID
ncbi:tyrosine-type recombinase/integrase [Frigoribacterium sp. RIT-PI-h]|uniref:tyrosine-type recombinase/integrase n=1 Tax=Frigoribacterium sp. RIT-PI-h TaxID=1690245 RepID=UPI000A86A8D4|nr:tyrosine-type recombinase/integrase [Frigoribacterium sp. RIT-PI-h]